MLTISENANPNYLAKICKIEELYPIEGADNLLRTVIGGYDMVVSKDMKIGDIVVYFPVECSICEKFLSTNNLYEFGEAQRNNNFDALQILITKMNKEDDADVAKDIYNDIHSMCGFFNKHGRVRMIKLCGQYSMGFVIPVFSLIDTWQDLLYFDFESNIGETFDTVCGEKLCWKYIPSKVKTIKPVQTKDSKWKKLMRKSLNRFNSLIENQFEFHYDTKKLEEEIDILTPDTNVTLTVKIHGVSVMLSNVLWRRKLSVWEKIKKYFGCKVETEEYKNVYASRKTIKDKEINPNCKSFYDYDIWGDVNKVFSKFITPGMTVYGEIVGYITGTKKCLQEDPDYDYGCEYGQWKFMPYRITITKKDGSKTELSVVDVMEWINYLFETFGEEPAYDNYKIKDVLMPMELLYNGKLDEIYPDVNENTDDFAKKLFQQFREDNKWLLMEKNEPLCKNKVPREGIVIRLNDDKLSRAWKLKTKKHIELEAKKHDLGKTDIEENNETYE